MSAIAERIKAGLEMRGMKQADLVRITNIGKSSISTYISGEYEPKQRNIYKIALALNVNEAWLMGHDVPPERDEGALTALPKTLRPLRKVYYVPRIGRIACGTPILAEENIQGQVLLPDGVRADFALDCSGDSMIDACIADGDTVFIRAQAEVENGEIAAVLIGEDATLKRVYRSGATITLMPANKSHEPLVYVKDEMANIQIIGKATAVLKLL